MSPGDSHISFRIRILEARLNITFLTICVLPRLLLDGRVIIVSITGSTQNYLYQLFTALNGEYSVLVNVCSFIVYL